MGLFNNREIATVIWIAVFAVWAIRKTDIRNSLATLVRTSCQVKIVAPVFLMALYTAGIVWLLVVVGFWKASFLKDTIVWFCFSAIAMMMHFVTSRDCENIFRKILIDSIKVIIILEFLVNTYTFPFYVEFFFVPGIAFVVMLGAFAETDKEYSAVSKLMNGIQIIVGLVILSFALSHAISDLHNLKSFDTFRSIALAPSLCLLFSPLLYAMVLISNYELVFLRLTLGREKETKLKRYAHRRILAYAGLSLKRVQQLLTNHAGDIMHLETEADVDRLLKDARSRVSSTSVKEEVSVDVLIDD